MLTTGGLYGTMLATAEEAGVKTVVYGERPPTG